MDVTLAKGMQRYRQRMVAGSLGSIMLLATLAVPVKANEEEATVQIVVELTSVAATMPTAVAGVVVESAEQLGTQAPDTYVEAGEVVRAPDLRRWHSVTVAAEHTEQALAELEAQPAVVQAHVAQRYHTAAIPNDTHFSKQYALESAVTPGADSNITAAWDVTTGSDDTIIAIIDGGVDLTHEDLAGKIWMNGDEVAGNGVDDDSNGFIDDMHGWDFVAQQPAGLNIAHATHVAGIAAASSNNGMGVSGVDWHARIMSVRVLGNGGQGYEDAIAEGIIYATANGADIINLSLVGPTSPLLSAAIEQAYAAGVVVVAALGNEHRDTTHYPIFPACADSEAVDMVVGVAATDDEGEPASFSNYGACTNIAAPGSRIYSTTRNNGYGSMTGTSMSAPLVAGVAGLYKAAHPQALPAEIIAALSQGDAFTGAKADEWNTEFKGKLNAATVVGVGSAPPPATPAPSPQPEPTPATTDEGGGGGDGGSDNGGGGGGGGGGEEVAPSVAKSKVAGARVARANMALLARVKDTFRFVYGRVPTVVEKTYWGNRIKRGEKTTYPALLGAMQWQKIKGKLLLTPVVAGAVNKHK